MNFRQQLQEAYEAGYRSALNEQDVYKRPVKVSALGGQKFHAIVDSKGVIVAAGLTEKEARKKKKFGQKVMELPGAKVGQVIKKEAYEAGYESGLNEDIADAIAGGFAIPAAASVGLGMLPGKLRNLIYGSDYKAKEKSIQDARLAAFRERNRRREAELEAAAEAALEALEAEMLRRSVR